MANSPQAIKRIRQNERRRAHNRSARTALRSAIKKLRAAVEAGDKDAAEAQLPIAISLLDKTASKGVIHRNKAARTKSRLVRAVRSA